MKKVLLATTGAICLAFGANAATVTATDGTQGWSETDTRPGGTAGIVDVSGAGGNLEANAPAGTGVVKLTTDATNAAKAEIGISQIFGSVNDIFNEDFKLSYTWYDTTGTSVAAPSIKLEFRNTGYAGDGYGQLVFEPYAQGPGSNAYITPTQGDWVTTTIDMKQGRAWNTGMFNIGSSKAGPPNNTLDEWLAAFDADFGEASLIGVSVGIGSYNPSEVGYFDNISLSINGTTTTWDFETMSAVPLPASLPLLLAGMAGLGMMGRRRRRT
ncbi:MAG: VPLPA-CTERM sorting domain-containing protein [Roseovarius sp.]|nr:VPLPA-CTERM sorting domain-containing protein [Roseovarius sp.]